MARAPFADTPIADEPAVQARGLIADFLTARDVERALAVTNLLSPSADCVMGDEGLTDIMDMVLPMQDSDIVASYIARLQSSGSVMRLCPKGVDDEIAANVWLKAGDDAKALEAAIRSRNPRVVMSIRLAIVERRLESGDIADARVMLHSAVAALTVLDTGNRARQVSAVLSIQLIHLLVRAGNVREAQRLATAYPGPGWRGFAYSVIVATMDRGKAVPNWGGPFLELPEVPADH